MLIVSPPPLQCPPFISVPFVALTHTILHLHQGCFLYLFQVYCRCQHWLWQHPRTARCFGDCTENRRDRKTPSKCQFSVDFFRNYGDCMACFHLRLKQPGRCCQHNRWASWQPESTTTKRRVSYRRSDGWQVSSCGQEASHKVSWFLHLDSRALAVREAEPVQGGYMPLFDWQAYNQNDKQNWAHMCDEQIKLKAHSPWSRFAKESVIPAVLPYARVVNSHRNSYRPVLILDRESLLFYQQYNAYDFDNSKLIGHCVTATLSVQSWKFGAIVADISDPVTPFHLWFSCLLFVLCVCRSLARYTGP